MGRLQTSYTGIGSADWILLELKSKIPGSYATFFSGFDIDDGRPKEVTLIHHPSSDVKKLSFDSDKPQDKTYTWVTKKWDTGSVEGASSGAPLYNQDRLVVGIQSTISKAQNICTNKKINSAAGKFYMAWDNNSNINNQVKHWLTTNSNLVAISGIETCKTSINFANANDLHTSNNIDIFLNFPNNLHLYGTRSYNGIYHSSGVIQAENNVTIQASTSVEFNGRMVKLKPGFKAETGSIFKASPNPCLGGCNNSKSLKKELSLKVSNVSAISKSEIQKHNFNISHTCVQNKIKRAARKIPLT